MLIVEHLGLLLGDVPVPFAKATLCAQWRRWDRHLEQV